MDDVHYMSRFAKEESFLFLVDSAKRDANTYPSPSQYSMEFHAPFRNVVGLDLIDASVPRTEYNVPKGTLSVSMPSLSPSSIQISIDRGDYNISQLVAALNSAMLTAGVPIIVSPETNPAEISNKLRFESADMFSLDMAYSGLRSIIGFSDPLPGLNPAMHRASASSTSDETRVAFQTSIPAYDPLHLTSSTLVTQPFVAGANGKLSTMMLYASSQGVHSIDVRVEADGSVCATATGIVVSTDTLTPTAIALTSSISLRYGTVYTIKVQVVMGEVELGMNPHDIPAECFSTTQDGSTEGTSSRLSMEMFVGYSGYVLASPGLVDLTGQRYILIRCPEIEQYLYKDRAFESMHPGLGMIKLGGYGFTQQRYDFVSFPPRRLSLPIGKLSKMTFALENPDGSLYDAQGINHTLLCVIKYMVVNQTPDQTNTYLNPQYNPDLRQYLTERHWKM